MLLGWELGIRSKIHILRDMSSVLHKIIILCMICWFTDSLIYSLIEGLRNNVKQPMQLEKSFHFYVTLYNTDNNNMLNIYKIRNIFSSILIYSLFISSPLSCSLLFSNLFISSVPLPFILLSSILFYSVDVCIPVLHSWRDVGVVRMLGSWVRFLD